MDRPLVTTDQAIDLANEIFGLNVDSSSVNSLKQLDSYDDRNFYLSGVKDGQEGEYLLKVYNRCYQNRDLFDAIHKVMFCLKDGGVICPVPLKTVSGDYLETRNFKPTPLSQNKAKKRKHEYDDKEDLFKSFVCLFTFVPGKTMKEHKDNGHVFNGETYYKFGQFVANIVDVLKDLKCPTLQERKFSWDIYHFDTMLRGQGSVSLEEKKLVKAVEHSFKKFVKPQFDILPKQCIHGDLNDANILVRKNPGTEQLEVFAVIDFGDVNYSCRVFEIAIAVAYMMLVAEDDIIKAAATTVAGFHDKCPLTEAESDVLFYCIQARLCQSGCFGTESSNIYPDNAEYLSYNATVALKVLKILACSSKEDFNKKWRDLCKN